MTAPTLFIQGGQGTGVNAGSRRYMPTLGSGPGLPATTTEAAARLQIPVAGTLGNLSFKASTSSHTTDVPITVRVAGSDTAITITVVAGTTSTYSTSNTASVNANDTTTIAADFGAGTGTLVSTFSLGFTPASGTVSSFCASDNATGTTWSGTGPLTFYAPPAGQMTATTSSTIGAAQITVPLAGTANSLEGYCVTNTRTTDSTATFNVAGSDTSLVITFPNGVNGSFQIDSSHTSAVAANDLVTCKIGLGTGTGNFVLTALGFWLTATTEGESACAAAAIAGSSLAAVTTDYNAIAGRYGGMSTTNTARTIPICSAATFSKMSVFVLTNASITDATAQFANNTTIGAQTVTLTAGVNGATYQDGSHSDAVVSGDLPNMVFTGATTGAVVITTVSFKMTTLTIVNGSAALVEIQDSLAATGTVLVSGSGALTEIQDSLAATGTVNIAGSVALTEIQDSLAASGTVVPNVINGAGALQEIQDAFAATGTVDIAGVGGLLEIQDSLAATGTVTLPAISGSAALTEIQDAFAAIGDNGAVQTGGHFLPLTEKQLRELKKRERRDRQLRDDIDESRKLDADAIEADIRATLAPKQNATIIQQELVVETEDDEDEDLEFILMHA